MPRRRLGEMRADHQHAAVGVLVDEADAGLASRLLVHVEGRGPPRHRALHRVVHQVAGDDRFLALRGNPHVDVAGRMAVARLAPDPPIVSGGDLMVRLDKVGHARGDDRIDAFDHVVGVVVAVVADLLPRLELGLAEQVAGVGEGRPVLSGLRVLVGVPADVVEVQVGAHHGVDFLAGNAEALQILQEAHVQVAENNVLALTPGTDAAVDDDRAARSLDHEALEVHPLPAIGRGVVRVQPVEREDFLLGRFGHGHADVVLEVPDLDDP